MTLQTDYNQQFSELVRRHEKIIFSVCFFYATPEVPFDDLRQEALISLFKSYRNFKGNSSESTWTYRVCINTCLLAIRNNLNKFETVSLESAPEISFDAEYDEELKLRLQWLHAAISILNPIDKAIIMMWLDELSYEEIAVNIGIPRNTVASRLSRIKAKLSAKKEI